MKVTILSKICHEFLNSMRTCTMGSKYLWSCIWHFTPHPVKGGFFSESAMKFFHFTVIGGKFKFQAQDSFLEFFFLRFGDLKNVSHFLKKKPPLGVTINTKSDRFIIYIIILYLKGYLPNLLVTALCHQIFVFWARDPKFWLQLCFLSPLNLQGQILPNLTFWTQKWHIHFR